MNEFRDFSRLTAEPTPILEFRAISKRYGQTVALSDVSLTVEAGSFVVLLGPSGSGKTTMLRCAAGIERISEGAVALDGAVVDDGRRPVPPERRDLAMVFQDYALWPHMTARQNVAYALKRRRLSGVEAGRRAEDFLRRVGLGALTERYPSELSGGEQQRVALARALVARPRLLLFDEPLSNLDASLRERMRVEIATLVREVAASALYITHDQAEAFALADKIGVLERGRLVQVGCPEEIYRSPATPFVARLTGLAGELGGTVTEMVADGVAALRVLDSRITARSTVPVRSGVDARVLIRPSAIRLHPPAATHAHFVATVRDVAFCGRGYEHLVELGDGSRLSGVFDGARWERGSAVGVTLSTDDCLVFAEGPGPVHAVPVVSRNGAFTIPSIPV